MDPDQGTTVRFRRVSGLLAPPAQGIANGDTGIPTEEISARLQFAFFAANAGFSMAAFFYGALRLAQHIWHFNFKPVEKSIIDRSFYFRSLQNGSSVDALIPSNESGADLTPLIQPLLAPDR